GKGRRRAANAFRVGELTVSPLIGGHSKPPAMQVDFYWCRFCFLIVTVPYKENNQAEFGCSGQSKE
ncbi:hypothetical protein KW524_21490, partial [Vibrio fluvialis]|nr:hypothetical protein [Vibrio fluvialis]